MPLASHHLIGLDELAHEPQVSQVSTSPALAFWVSATLPDFLLFFKHGHWLCDSVLPTYSAGTLVRGHRPLSRSVSLALPWHREGRDYFVSIFLMR